MRCHYPDGAKHARPREVPGPPLRHRGQAARDYQDAAAHEDLVDALARDALALAEKPG